MRLSQTVICHVHHVQTVNAGIKFIIRDIAQQVGEHKEKLVRQKQGRDAHPERKGVGGLPREGCRKEAVKPFTHSSSSRSLSFFRPIIWFLLPQLTYPGTFSWVCMHPSAKMNLKGFWEEPRLTVAWHCSSTFDPQGAFLRMCSVSLVWKEGVGRALNPLFTQGLCPLFVFALITAMTITLTCLQKTNTGYLPCFCCYFHFGGQRGGWF